MNHKNIRALRAHLSTLGNKAKAIAVGGAAAMTVPSAFAQAAGGFDPASVLATVAAMVAAGILIYTAFAVGKWTMKAFGLIGGK
ncbi:hypothetical protein [Xanthomonas arboricola]|uniref:hypothetical protein n=1 Tax=Xanthomonas arboricola TaxID=56448 RepID=UPI00063E977E|nr:hypothetical protein [Xanthomonas arboricola]MEB1221473.1 hypothetical protein [Xanthomonas campestris pv. campestris]MBB3849755.1 hypothetical protein [Xanthomonas arboricola]MEB1244884.1 hypothetical protein [Xanthomonas campestris pv. campestris]MEB1253383.1 hypothetical protein [Xanthomonas campestris pv. campestris]MEB1291775.1 hypothetical protein [Xanthomonas campestris pv. campestris]